MQLVGGDAQAAAQLQQQVAQLQQQMQQAQQVQPGAGSVGSVPLPSGAGPEALQAWLEGFKKSAAQYQQQAGAAPASAGPPASLAPAAPAAPAEPRSPTPARAAALVPAPAPVAEPPQPAAAAQPQAVPAPAEVGTCGTAQAGPTYYIGADEVPWDYAPAGRNQCNGQPFTHVTNSGARLRPRPLRAAAGAACLDRGTLASAAQRWGAVLARR